MANLKNTNIDNNLELPEGTTAQRPASPQEGQIRYNTDLGVTEFYNGSNWRPLSDTHAKAEGGTVVDTDIGGVPYRIHYFTETGTDTLTVTNPGEVEYLIVAAGGGGTAGHGSGGSGAGGLVTGITTVTPQSYTITVGAGGTGGTEPTTSETGTDGGNSSALGIIALGGGTGGSEDDENPHSGGSGGGGSGTNDSKGASKRIGAAGLQSTSASGGFGNKGGDGNNTVASGYGGGGGGGGAGSPGDNATNSSAGKGGEGLMSNITGIATFYAGGGGGGGWTSAGQANGLSGLGSGAPPDGGSATPNTGGGASGTDAAGSREGGAGGSGIVIVRYPRNSGLNSEPDQILPSLQPYTFTNDVRSAIARDGLVLELDAANLLSYSGTGTEWTDLSGTGNNGSLQNGIGYTDQNYGALTFNGSNQYVTTNNDIVLTSHSYVIVASRDLSVGGLQGLMGNHTIGQNISINSSSGDDIAVSAGYASGRDVYQMRTLCFKESNKFYHITFTYDSTTRRITFYINGILKNTKILPQAVETTPRDIVIGRWAESYNDYYHVGNIGLALAYNRVLTETEITQNFNATRGRYGI